MKEFHDMRFDSIQVLRAIAALLVVAEHIHFLSCGAFGVDIFFCISGFMIMFTTHRSTDHFLIKRFLRIAPLYYIMTFFTFFIVSLVPSMFVHTTGGIPALIKSLFFIPFDVGQGYIQPLVRIGWTINLEMFFYCIFWISFHISHKYRGFICSFFLLLIVLVGPLISSYQLPIEMYNAIHFWSDPIILEFVLGIISYDVLRWIYEYVQKHPQKMNRLIGKSCMILSIIMILILVDHRMDWAYTGLTRILVWGIPSMLIMIGFFIAGLSLQMNRWWVMLGNISFSLYMVHYYPIQFFDRILFDFSTLRADSLFFSLLVTIFVIILSYFMYLWIEKRFTSWILQKI